MSVDESTVGERLKRFEVSAVAMPGFLSTGTRRFESDLPIGAEIRRAGYDPERDVFYITVEHESFRPVREGERIPRGEVIVEELEGY
ncbi:hypothetical protein C482_15331 [Natrialba chahannaoensis JCM 10990]|uniref:Uncharacterized protein n=1 Tax=Natrialba chahannaoensis JCM 10990 TaxID=1227492 RepID=M0ADY6_9EURY|nr:hypothetical protein [Natrialba chahannaoensis]ELY96759.1 hypothetical protein C482_15331 [Natrialba chahannaoensis JCM 10990]